MYRKRCEAIIALEAIFARGTGDTLSEPKVLGCFRTKGSRLAVRFMMAIVVLVLVLVLVLVQILQL